MRAVLMVCAVLGLAGPLAAQTRDHKMEADPDKVVEGGGALPAGWQARLDGAGAKVTDLKFATMGEGFHATTGPAAIFYDPSRTGTGEYQAKASFTQTKLAPHPEAYGLLIGGSDLSGAGQKYTYFLVRQDGRFLIKRRMGADTANIVDWTEHVAVNKPDPQGRTTNALTIAVGKDQVRFLVNETEVATQPRTGVDADGIVGLRVNHNLDVHIGGFSVGAGSTN